MGMIATGKSYLAQTLAEKMGCSYYNSDVVRKEIAGEQAEYSRFTATGEGIYSRDFSRRTYGELLTRVEADICKTECNCAILDASYQSKAERQRVCQCLGRLHELLFIHCVAPEKVTKQRMEARGQDPDAVSDGRWEVYLEQKKCFEYPVELDKEHLVTLDTNRPLHELLSFLEELLKR